MLLKYIAQKNLERCGMWHQKGGLNDWSPLEWAAAMNEEAGEAMEAVVQMVIAVTRATGFIKKMRRLESGISASNNSATVDEARNKVRKELGDAFLYMDLVAQACHLDMEDCIVYAFNTVSDREGLPVKLIGEYFSPDANLKVHSQRGNADVMIDVRAAERPVAKVYQAPDNRDENTAIMYEACNGRLKALLSESEQNYKEMKKNYEGACRTIAEMYMAAMGHKDGPEKGVVEDLRTLREKLEKLEIEKRHQDRVISALTEENNTMRLQIREYRQK